MKTLNCLRCNDKMSFIKTEKIQLGETGWFLGDLPNLISGSMEVDIYSCPSCGKVEFFQGDSSLVKNEIPQIKCPKCGKSHDFDYPKCPFCQYQY